GDLRMDQSPAAHSAKSAGINRDLGKSHVMDCRMACVTMTASSPTAQPRGARAGRTAMDPATKRALFEQTVMPHLNAAYNLARWLTRNGDDAEDLVQDAYLRAFRSFDTFQGQDGRAWLLAVVRNTCFSWLRKK